MKFLRIVGKVLLGLIGLCVVALLIALYAYRDVPVEVLEARYANEAAQFMEIAGVRVHYRDEGPRDAPVLVLDDCFSSVDTKTEEHILSELARLRSGQTTILVSHRVSTARHSDRILIMDGGRIVEEGSHEALIAAGGFYAELERIQREGADEADFDFLGATS